jgi:cytidylate kinase
VPDISQNLPPVLALDGPSGAGKGTIGQICSLKFGWHYLDSGAIYRGLAWLATNQGVSLDDVSSLVALADGMDLTCHVCATDSATIEINGHMVTDQLRTDEAGQLASRIAPIADVRAALLNMQRVQQCSRMRHLRCF